MLVSFDIKLIRRDHKQGRNGEVCRAVIENTMLVSFDIKFLGQDQKQHRNGEVCRASPTCFWSSPNRLDIKRHLRGFLFIMHY